MQAFINLFTNKINDTINLINIIINQVEGEIKTNLTILIIWQFSIGFLNNFNYILPHFSSSMKRRALILITL